MNTGIMDAHNLAWKLGMLCKNIAKPGLLDTYDVERRENALRAVATSARYLRFVGNCTFQNIDGSETEADPEELQLELGPGEDPHIAFFKAFAKANTKFLIGHDVDYRQNVINRAVHPAVKGVREGYRAPDPRVAVSRSVSARLYDIMGRLDQFTILVFGSNLQGDIAPKLKALDTYLASPTSFNNTYARTDLFKILLIARATPTEAEKSVTAFPYLHKNAQLVFDDQLPASIFGSDAHAVYGVDHKQGAVVAVRPDTWVGTAVTIDEVSSLESYFGAFLYGKYD